MGRSETPNAIISPVARQQANHIGFDWTKHLRKTVVDAVLPSPILSY